ncbi:hypothetical protein HNR39_002682 [Glaciimonas immobilis]|uniref:Uncharacterized protein n=1 Tax=Glaciimonas immobilis TaxID=728004 RepID=A0A840RWK1_9BURK|nr:hypothetical protein [Glaciimonas immobilis]
MLKLGAQGTGEIVADTRPITELAKRLDFEGP